MYTFHKSTRMAESGGRKPGSLEGFHRDNSPFFYQVGSWLSQPQSEYNLGTNTIIVSRVTLDTLSKALDTALSMH